jgi:ATP-binding cassette, subfamily C, bacterial PrsD
VKGLIELLPLGYRTQINGVHEAFPPALLHGIALARALYGDPFLVMLDEADTNFGVEGDARLAGGIVVVVADAATNGHAVVARRRSEHSAA